MKKLVGFTAASIVMLASFSVFGNNDNLGKKCFSDAECGGQLNCNDGVCVKKKEFDFGGGKSGQPCNIDADCINSGKCVEGNFGKKYCSGN